MSADSHAQCQPVSREAIAKIVYDAFPFEPRHGMANKPEWVPSGNSWRQDDARRAADAILALPATPADGAREALADCKSHFTAWRRALELAKAMAAPAGVDHDDAAYWDHEIRAFDRTFAALRAPVDARTGREACSCPFDGCDPCPACVAASRPQCGVQTEALRAAEKELIDLARPVSCVFNRTTKKYEFTDAHIKQALPGTFGVIEQIRAALALPSADRGGEAASAEQEERRRVFGPFPWEEPR